ncbi:MAG: hypothetical protein M3R53_01340 [Candidatus Eremiobacteraeota bacterium]|nr:hypothetical protein [Candidatus Eremiobacteraeota bacterium]
MSLAPRDQEAFDLVAARSFGDAYVVSFELEMQARRLTLVVYGALRDADATTFAATLTFFGTSALAVDNRAGAFPQSVSIASLTLSYDETSDEVAAELTGRQNWTLGWSFEGLAYDERPAVLTSLADDL